MRGRPGVLFVCVHNSARSQMAEAFVNLLCPGYRAQSAGLEPGRINPIVVEVMNELGIDLATKTTQSVFDVARRGERFTYVITVCDEASERCPVFPGGAATRLAWSFPDPSSFTGSLDEKRDATRRVRDAIKRQIEAWCATECAP
jgi:arsenate reductase (thioredoxin)